eukprot:SAG11_NODE_6535_length_1293_cov_2.219430_1_plen_48_part_10
MKFAVCALMLAATLAPRSQALPTVNDIESMSAVADSEPEPAFQISPEN